MHGLSHTPVRNQSTNQTKLIVERYSKKKNLVKIFPHIGGGGGGSSETPALTMIVILTEILKCL